MELDDDEKQANYQALIDSINYIRDGKRITEDWITEQVKYLNVCRDVFPDMTKMNVEISEKRWRGMAQDCELMLSQLLWEHSESKTISVPIYLRFCETIKRMLEYYATDDDLTDSINSMSM